MKTFSGFEKIWKWSMFKKNDKTLENKPANGTELLYMQSH
jgi:hypothetical protein